MSTLRMLGGLALVSGCSLHAQSSRVLQPLQNEGEVYLYLQPLPAEVERLAFTIESIAVARASGIPAPLELVLPDISGSTVPRQRLLAWGRLPPGAYTQLLVQVKRATVATEGKAADLLVSKEPTPLALRLEVARGRATVLLLSLQHAPSLAGVEFTPAFDVTASQNLIPDLAGYCSNGGTADLTAFNKLKREVMAVIPVGREPQGLVLDSRQNRIYVALAGEDQVEILDAITGEDLGRIRLHPGDRPQEITLSPDGKLVISVNRESSSVSFLDPVTLSEVDRVQLTGTSPGQTIAPIGEEPVALLTDRSGKRGYVFNRRSSSITILDLASHSVAGTIRTEPEPLRGQLNRTGTRLYVVHGSTAYLSVFSIPDLALVNRLFVGLGASAIKVDPRTDLIYVGYRDDNRVQVFDPMLPLPIDSIELPGGVSYMTIADQENALLLLFPDLRSLGFVDLTRRKLLSLVDVGASPYFIVTVGER
jgi:YVTN family beta-propeller protein